MTSLRSASPAAGVAVLALLVGGCSGGGSVDQTGEQEEQEPVATVDATLVAVLADGADRLAERVAADEHCEALEEADLLYTRSREGAEDDRVPEEVAREIEDVVTELSHGLSCEPEDDEPGDDDPETTTQSSSSGSGSTSSGTTSSDTTSSGSTSSGSSGGGNDNKGKGNNSGGGKGNGNGGKGK
jgi:hypothetical protein